MDVQALLKQMVDKGVSDIFIIAGRPLSFKLGNRIQSLNEEILTPALTRECILGIYALSGGRDADTLLTRGDDDFSFSIPGVSRFRVNTYKQRGSLAAVIRVVAFHLPDPKALHIPDSVLQLADKRRGLLLFTGPSGSGKTTSLACLIDRINATRNAHIITLENPIEYLHSHRQSIISQREISIDTDGYAVALRAALRQSPDVILIGELRDAETISITLTAAETGHLVISTLHTLGTANAIDRLVDAFPASQQNLVRMQLSMVLQSVIFQQLVPARDGGMQSAFEIMHCNSAIRNLIRDGRTHQIPTVIQSGGGEGMVSMDMSLLRLYREGVITAQEAVLHSLAPEAMARQVGL